MSHEAQFQVRVVFGAELTKLINGVGGPIHLIAVNAAFLRRHGDAAFRHGLNMLGAALEIEHDRLRAARDENERRAADGDAPADDWIARKARVAERAMLLFAELDRAGEIGALPVAAES